MNYLAHSFLSDHSDGTLVGGFLGDFVKGRLDNRYLGAVRQGIALHRAIDRYTDRHPVVRASHALMSARRRRFAGIMVDVFYDHFLARHWVRYSPIPLQIFTRQVYRALYAHNGALPPRLQQILPRMRRDDWLGSYGELAAVSAALNGIARRFRHSSRAQPLTDGIEELERNYNQLETHFLDFFPELMGFAQSARRELQAGDSTNPARAILDSKQEKF